MPVPLRSPRRTRLRSRRRTFGLAVLVLLLLLILTWGSRWLLRVQPFPSSPSGPSILLITLDTTRADRLGCYGHPQPTSPTLDQLATAGIRFADAEAPTPLTLPSHASLLTGVFPRVHGLRDNGIGALAEGLPTLAGTLQQAGYATAAFVSAAPLDDRFGLDRGFQTYDDPGDAPAGADPAPSAYPYPYPYAYAYGYRYAYGQAYPEGVTIRHVERPGEITVNRALHWLQTAPRPFFLWVHLFEPHLPYQPHPDCSAILDDPYDAEIRTADRQVARLIRALDSAGERQRCTILVAGDHGEGLGEHDEPAHALLCYRSTLHVPLIIDPAGEGLANVVVEAPVSLVDVAVTLASQAGCTLGDRVQGQDLLAVARGEPPATPLLGESLHGRRNFGWAPLGSWREGQLRLVTGVRDELFDLAADPGETSDLAAARPEDAARLRAAHDACCQSLDPEAHPPRMVGLDPGLLRSLPYPSTGASPLPPVAGRTLRDPRDGMELSRALDDIKAALAGRQLTTARAQAEKLLPQDPTNPFLHILLARACKGLSDLEGATQALEQARQLDPGNVEVLAGLLDLRLHRLDALEDEEQVRVDLEGILEDATALVAAAPWSSSLRYNLGRAHRRAGDLPAAREEFRQALEGGFPRARADLVTVLLELGEPQRAIALLEEATERGPALELTRRLLLQGLVAAGTRAELDGQLEQAQLSYVQALRVDPTSSLAHQGQARVLLARGQLDPALEAAVEAVRHDERNPDARLLLARVFLAAGREEEAGDQLREALQLDPTNQQARQLLDRLR